MPTSKSYENPLLSHERMRAMYFALLETRLLGLRGGRRAAFPRLMEAIWVGTCIDLHAGDLVSGPFPAHLVESIRAGGSRSPARLARPAELRSALAPRPPASAASPAEHLLLAIGQARAMLAAADGRLSLVFLPAAGVSPAEWKHLLALANENALPLAILTVPDPKTSSPDLHSLTRKLPGPPIPVIPVDAGDSVALFRVAQETCLRARADGGVAVIECVAGGTDPVPFLASQLLRKGIATQRWIDTAQRNLDKLAAAL